MNCQRLSLDSLAPLISTQKLRSNSTSTRPSLDDELCRDALSEAEKGDKLTAEFFSLCGGRDAIAPPLPTQPGNQGPGWEENPPLLFQKMAERPILDLFVRAVFGVNEFVVGG
jgi:hypothetical protein